MNHSTKKGLESLLILTAYLFLEYLSVVLFYLKKNHWFNHQRIFIFIKENVL
jgi:hypothetical protein